MVYLHYGGRHCAAMRDTALAGISGIFPNCYVELKRLRSLKDKSIILCISSKIIKVFKQKLQEKINLFVVVIKSKGREKASFNIFAESRQELIFLFFIQQLIWSTFSRTHHRLVCPLELRKRRFKHFKQISRAGLAKPSALAIQTLVDGQASSSQQSSQVEHNSSSSQTFNSQVRIVILLEAISVAKVQSELDLANGQLSGQDSFQLVTEVQGTKGIIFF